MIEWRTWSHCLGSCSTEQHGNFRRRRWLMGSHKRSQVGKQHRKSTSRFASNSSTSPIKRKDQSHSVGTCIAYRRKCRKSCEDLKLWKVFSAEQRKTGSSGQLMPAAPAFPGVKSVVSHIYNSAANSMSDGAERMSLTCCQCLPANAASKGRCVI